MVLNYITATSPKGLRRFMLRNNVRLGYFVNYINIQQMQDGRWIAWYYANIEHEASKKPLEGQEAD